MIGQISARTSFEPASVMEFGFKEVNCYGIDYCMHSQRIAMYNRKSLGEGSQYAPQWLIPT